jgi:hypothetical protein
MGDKGGGGGNRAASFATHLANYYHQQTKELTEDAIARGEGIMGSPKEQWKFAKQNI